MNRAWSAAALLVLAAQVGCSSDASGPPPDIVPTLSIVSGDAQAAGPQQIVPHPLVVRVTTAGGDPLAGYVVTWIVTGGGAIAPSSPATNEAGQAEAHWTLGYSGPQEVEARAYYSSNGGLWPVSAKFRATVVSPVTPTTQKPAIVHYDGSAWTVVYQPPVTSQAVVSLLSVWGSSASSIYAVGAYCGVEAYLRYDGTSWSPPVPEGPPGCGGLGPIENNVTGSSASNVFRIQSGCLPPSGCSSEVQHFDGTSWTNAYHHGCSVTGFCLERLNAVWTDSPSDAVVVGTHGFIAVYNGSVWNDSPSGTTSNLQAVWGVASAPTPRVFAVGDAGTILTYDGTSWQPQSSGTTQTLRAVWGTSATDVYAVGDAGVIVHYDGSTWSTQATGARALYGLWGISPTSVYAVGDGPTILHYDGSGWMSLPLNIPIDLRAIWGSSPTDIYAVGGAQQ